MFTSVWLPPQSCLRVPVTGCTQTQAATMKSYAWGVGKSGEQMGAERRLQGKFGEISMSSRGEMRLQLEVKRYLQRKQQTWGNQIKQFWKRRYESAKSSWRAGTGDEENWRRSSTSTKAEKGKVKRPLVEALGWGLEEKSQRDPQSGRDQVAEEINRHRSRTRVVTIEWMTWREMKLLIPQMFCSKGFKNFKPSARGLLTPLIQKSKAENQFPPVR